MQKGKNINIVLEYQGTQARDLIQNVAVVGSKDWIELQSAINGLKEMGFELEPQSRLSYFKSD